MIDSYLYTIGKSLPPKGRAEILEEIKSNLYDYLEENYGQKAYSLEEETAAIKALGHPKAVAQAYNKASDYLIGPGYIDLYWLVLKIALIGSFIGISSSTAFGAIHGPLDVLIKIIGRFWQGSLSVVGLVTIIFMIIHYYAPKNEAAIKEDWSLDSLEEMPQSYEKISRGELIVESIILFFVLYFMNQGFNWTSTSESLQVIVPTFNMSVFRPFLWLINGILAVNLLTNFYLIFVNKWQKISCILSIFINIFIILLFWWLFFTPDLIDYNAFVGQMKADQVENLVPVLKMSVQIGLLVITGINLYDIYQHVKRLVKFSK